MTSDRMMSVLAGLVVAYIRLVYKSNRLVEFDEQRADRLLAEHAPVIVTCWHGQHFIAPMFTRGGEPSVAMVSRSKDAELNARVVEKLGFETVRASGGRASARMANKGAVRGILALREKLRAGHSVFMMADIPHGTPREAGLGIVSIARFTGAPIVPIAYASSRRHVFQKAWDKAVMNLPFGRAALYFGDPIRVPPDADDAKLEELRLELQNALNSLLDKAHATVDAPA
ncbi:MAG: lysophospholipid acyltransferase family protein [Oricola sp.]|nr:lysophospholipid acyltransferase family protein [Oricola sp.]